MRHTTPRRKRSSWITMLLAPIALPAAAADIKTSDGWEGSWTNTFSFYNAWRADDRDPHLYTAADGASIGLTGAHKGSAGNGTDGGTLNYAKGDRISTELMWITDLSLKRGNFGFRLRAKAWDDFALSNGNVPYGNIASRYTKNAPLSDQGFDTLQRFSGAYLLDAYVYESFQLGGHDAIFKLGRQTLPWGESVFIQGINQVNPVDIGEARKPGFGAQDTVLPIWALSGEIATDSGGTFAGFYQFVSEYNNIPSCGTYWATLELSSSINPQACNAATVVPNPVAPSSADAYAAGLYVPMQHGQKARNGGEYGLNWRYMLTPLHTELSLYGMNLSSRLPIISGMAGDYLRAYVPTSPLISPLVAQEKLGLTPASAFLQFPKNIHVFGAGTTTTVLGGAKFRTELSYSPNVPVQRNGNDLLTAGILGVGPLGKQALATIVPALGGHPGTVLPGYDRFSKTQFVMNGLVGARNILGADLGILVAETGLQWSNIPNYRSPGALRYGRAFVFGTGSDPRYPGGTTCITGSVAPPIANPSAAGCKDDGYDTPFAWGARLRAQLNYNDIFKSGGDFILALTASADIKGYSIDNQFIQGRRQYLVSGRYNWKNYGIELDYSNLGNATYDPLRDRDFYAVSLTAAF